MEHGRSNDLIQENALVSISNMKLRFQMDSSQVLQSQIKHILYSLISTQTFVFVVLPRFINRCSIVAAINWGRMTFWKILMLSHCAPSSAAVGHRKRVTEKLRDLLGGLVLQEWEDFVLKVNSTHPFVEKRSPFGKTTVTDLGSLGSDQSGLWWIGIEQLPNYDKTYRWYSRPLWRFTAGFSGS